MLLFDLFMILRTFVQSPPVFFVLFFLKYFLEALGHIALT